MKFILLLLTISASAHAQVVLNSQNPKYIGDLPFNKEGQMIVEEVVQEEASASDLYSRSKLFFVETFNSANDVIQLDDNTNHVVVGKGISIIPYKSMGFDFKSSMHYTIKIESKEGRYKYSIYDIYYDSGAPDYIKAYPKDLFLQEVYTKEYNKKKEREVAIEIVDSYKASTQAVLWSLMEDIKKEMSKPVSSSNEDW